MNRRKLLLGSGVALSTIFAGCSSDDTSDGNGDDTPPDDDIESGEENVDAVFSGVFNYRKYDRFTTPDSSDNVHWGSDDETQYVGAQVRLTNNTDAERSIGGYEIGILAGDNGGNITFHSRSNTDPLESIGAGETVETWLVFTVSPGTEIEGFGPTQWAEHSFDLTRDESLEIALQESMG